MGPGFRGGGGDIFFAILVGGDFLSKREGGPIFISNLFFKCNIQWGALLK